MCMCRFCHLCCLGDDYLIRSSVKRKPGKKFLKVRGGKWNTFSWTLSREHFHVNTFSWTLSRDFLVNTFSCWISFMWPVTWVFFRCPMSSDRYFTAFKQENWLEICPHYWVSGALSFHVMEFDWLVKSGLQNNSQFTVYFCVFTDVCVNPEALR